MDHRADLLATIARLSFRLGDFTLASGAKSDYYIDCRTTTLSAEGGRLCGIVLHELLRTNHVLAEAVGGLTMGADPLVSNIATATAYARQHDAAAQLLEGFLVRKAQKTHGTGRQIEGYVQPGARVVIVDDVCTTGGSTITAIDAARAADKTVAAVVCLVDREQGGRQAIEAAVPGAPFLTAYTATQVRAEKLRQHATRHEKSPAPAGLFATTYER